MWSLWSSLIRQPQRRWVWTFPSHLYYPVSHIQYCFRWTISWFNMFWSHWWCLMFASSCDDSSKWINILGRNSCILCDIEFGHWAVNPVHEINHPAIGVAHKKDISILVIRPSMTWTTCAQWMFWAKARRHGMESTMESLNPKEAKA